MLEVDFVPLNKQTAEKETKKRNELIAWFSGYIDDSVVAMIVSGSMSYGENYSVKPGSDIDIQLLVTPKSVLNLKKLDCFDSNELQKAIAGYLDGVYGQFSLVFQKNDVNMECHFWDFAAFISAITYKSSETKRLRSSVESPSTDHGFSFARNESIKDYYGEIASGYPVGVFPSFREEDGELFLCRPITNILGMPRIEKSNPELGTAIKTTWEETIRRLTKCASPDGIDLKAYNVVNTLPGKNKMKPEALKKIHDKTVDMVNTAKVKISANR